MGRRLLCVLTCVVGVVLLYFAAQNFTADDLTFRRVSRGSFQTVIGLTFVIGGVYELIRPRRPGGFPP